MSEIDELRQLEEAWCAAIEGRDAAAADAILAENFVLTSAGGVGPWVSREEWFSNLEQIETSALGISDFEARTFGDVAVVRLLAHWDARIGDRDLSDDYSIVDVFTRESGTWQVSWRVSQRMP